MSLYVKRVDVSGPKEGMVGHPPEKPMTQRQAQAARDRLAAGLSVNKIISGLSDPIKDDDGAWWVLVVVKNDGDSSRVYEGLPVVHNHYCGLRVSVEVDATFDEP